MQSQAERDIATIRGFDGIMQFVGFSPALTLCPRQILCCNQGTVLALDDSKGLSDSAR